MCNKCGFIHRSMQFGTHLDHCFSNIFRHIAIVKMVYVRPGGLTYLSISVNISASSPHRNLILVSKHPFLRARIVIKQFQTCIYNRKANCGSDLEFKATQKLNFTVLNLCLDTNIRFLSGLVTVHLSLCTVV